MMALRLLLVLSVLGVAACISGGHSHASVVVPYRWDPAPHEIARCEAKVARRLSREGLHFREYCVRYYALHRDGTRVLVGYAEHRSVATDGLLAPPETERHEFDPVRLPPFGGGSWYFQFTYVPARNELSDFALNAPL